MAETLPVLRADNYPLADPGGIPSPRLLLFRAPLERNIARMRSLLEEIAPGSGFRHLRTHAKTAKSSWTVRLQLGAGIGKHKASPNELEMLLAAGARDVLLAYPPLPPVARAVARAIGRARVAGGERLRLLAQVGAPEHVRALGEAARAEGVDIECLVDLDVGMGRTGVAPEAAGEVLNRLLDEPRLSFAGLHAYDGHTRGPTPEARAERAAEAMGRLVRCAEGIQREGVPVGLIVAGGTPGFLPDLAWLLRERPAEEIEVSPGTWIYWDSNYDRMMPGLFEPAALILARVMDRPGSDRITLDLGYKRWAIDAGPLEAFSLPGLEVVATSEEHTVLRLPGGGERPRIGDHLLIVPRHVCPTINLWEDFTVIGPRGEIEIESCPVDGRNR